MLMFGGDGGIRTPNRLAPVPHFSVRFMPFSNSVTQTLAKVVGGGACVYGLLR